VIDMPGTKTIPERCIARSKPDEPLFTLCARDIAAPDTVRDWARRAAKAGAPAAKVGQALLDAEAMERWQRKHGAKIPD
jgi:hypothetical protein